MASGPVSSWTDTDVVQYKLLRWDHQLLKLHAVPMEAYQKAHDQFSRLNKGSKDETKKLVTATFVEHKLIVKLLELRAAAGQAMRDEPRIA